MFVSVIICTHNPNPIILKRVLDGLSKQTLDLSKWELLIIDNKSKVEVGSTVHFNWHPQSKIIVEKALGLTNARLRGIKESTGDLLIFVDDDNILSNDYLENAYSIAEEFPFIGAFGGSCIGEFEIEPPSWFHTSILGLRDVKSNQWSNSISSLEDCPIGAGMVVRRNVAEVWKSKCEGNSLGISLGRNPNSLLGGEDFDLAFTACDIGLGRGLFKSLRLIHYIPKERLTLKYFLRMKEGITFSLIILFSLRSGKPEKYSPSLRKRFVRLFQFLRMSKMNRKIYSAKERGRTRALEILHNKN
jgi:glycosyltransferase involved in cell wall biosynthesis